MEFVLELYKGCKCVKTGKELLFGMTPEEVSEALGEESQGIVRGSEEMYTYLTADYKNNLAVAFQFYSEAVLYIDDERYPKLCGKNLCGMKHKELKKIIKQYDPDCIDDAGVQSLKMGIGTYYESTAYQVPEAIIIFKQGYYD